MNEFWPLKLTYCYLTRTYHLVDFAVPTKRSLNVKQNKKTSKYLDLAKDLKKLKNIKVMVIMILAGALGTVTDGLEKGQRKLEIRGKWRLSWLQHC